MWPEGPRVEPRVFRWPQPRPPWRDPPSPRESSDPEPRLAWASEAILTACCLGETLSKPMLEALGRLDLRASLHRVDVPTLVVHGGADRRSPFSAAVAIAQAIPHARLVELAGLGHDCCGEAEFIGAIERFLVELGGGAATRDDELVSASSPSRSRHVAAE